jgi:hypothetical protein
VITGADLLNPLSDRFDDPRSLMTEDRRKSDCRNEPRFGNQVGVANAASHNPYEDFIALRCLELDFLELERAAFFINYCSFYLHDALLQEHEHIFIRNSCSKSA